MPTQPDHYREVEVVSKTTYLIPMHDDTTSMINAWTPEKLIEHWFEKFPLNRSHASRDAYRVGGSQELVSATLLERKL